MFFSLSQGDNGQIPGSEKSWSPGDEVSEVDGQLNDDQAAHELCKTCTEKIDSAEPQRGTFSIVFNRILCSYKNRRTRIPYLDAIF